MCVLQVLDYCPDLVHLDLTDNNLPIVPGCLQARWASITQVVLNFQSLWLLFWANSYHCGFQHLSILVTETLSVESCNTSLSSEILKTWPFIKCGPYNLRQRFLEFSVSKGVSLFRASYGQACQKQWMFDLKFNPLLRILKPSNHFSILRASLNQKDTAEFKFEHILSTFNEVSNVEIWKVKSWLCTFKKRRSVQPHLARVQTSLLVHRLLMLARRCIVLIFCNANRWQELRSLHLEGNGLYFKKLRGYSQILGKELPRSVAFWLLSEKEVVEEELRTALWEEVEDIEDEQAHDASSGTTEELIVESMKVRSHNSLANKPSK